MASTEGTVEPRSANRARVASTIRRRRRSILASRRSWAAGTANLARCQRAGDDQALDLARAFEQRVDVGVAMPLPYREVADVAVAAADLARFLGHLHRDLAG